MTDSNGTIPGVRPRSAAPMWRWPDMWRLVLVTALGFTSFFLTLGSVPLWAVRGGASETSAGSVTAVLLACTILAQAAVPALRRRVSSGTLLAFGLLALGAPAPLYLIAGGLPGLIAVSAVRGVGFALLTVVAARLVSQVAPPDRQGQAVGLYGLAIAVPNLLAVPAGVALTSSNHFLWVAGLAACSVVALPLAWRFRHDDSTAVPPTRQEVRRTIRAAVTPSMTLLVVTTSGGGLVAFLPIALPAGQLSSITLLVFGFTGALGRWRAGVAGERMGVRLLLSLSLVASALGLASVAAALFASGNGLLGAGWITVMLAGAAVLGAGYGATQNLSQIAVFARPGVRNATTASAVWNIFFDGGTAIGSYGVGVLAATGLHLTGAFLTCAMLTVAALPAAIASAR